MTARTRLAALALTGALLACLGGASGRAPGTPAPPAAAGTVEGDRLLGAFWRPAGSEAKRPALRLARAAWAPPASDARRPHRDTLASLRAVVRLAASD